MDSSILPSYSHENERRVYGRRQGRPLNPARKDALDALYPTLKCDIPLSKENGATISPRTLFENTIDKVICEIGFGDGDHLAKMIEYNPHNGYIGAEPYINGMSAFLKDVRDNALPQANIRVWMEDAILLLETFTDKSLDCIYVLNPDPWPKARHHKRRIINQDNLSLFARLLKPGAQLIMTTDVDDLAEWMVTHASNHPDFEWTANCEKDWKTPPQGWIPTKYELKGKAAGRIQTYLIFQRK